MAKVRVEFLVPTLCYVFRYREGCRPGGAGQKNVVVSEAVDSG